MEKKNENGKVKAAKRKLSLLDAQSLESISVFINTQIYTNTKYISQS